MHNNIIMLSVKCFNTTIAKVDCQTTKISSLPNFLAIKKKKKNMVRDTDDYGFTCFVLKVSWTSTVRTLQKRQHGEDN